MVLIAVCPASVDSTVQEEQIPANFPILILFEITFRAPCSLRSIRPQQHRDVVIALQVLSSPLLWTRE